MVMRLNKLKLHTKTTRNPSRRASLTSCAHPSGRRSSASDTPGAHPRSAPPGPNYERIPGLQPVLGQVIKGCVPFRCVETTLEIEISWMFFAPLDVQQTLRPFLIEQPSWGFWVSFDDIHIVFTSHLSLENSFATKTMCLFFPATRTFEQKICQVTIFWTGPVLSSHFTHSHRVNWNLYGHNLHPNPFLTKFTTDHWVGVSPLSVQRFGCQMFSGVCWMGRTRPIAYRKQTSSHG